MIKIKRTKAFCDEIGIGYLIERANDPIGKGILTRTQFYSLLQEIGVICDYPYIVKETRMIRLVHSDQDIWSNRYRIRNDGRLPFITTFSLRDLEEIHETSMLLTTHDYNQFFAKYIALEAQSRGNK